MDAVNQDEILAEFAKVHLSWIHQVEQMANRRLTDHEVLALRDLEQVNDFDKRLEVLREINTATTNFVEGIVE